MSTGSASSRRGRYALHPRDAWHSFEGRRQAEATIRKGFAEQVFGKLTSRQFENLEEVDWKNDREFSNLAEWIVRREYLKYLFARHLAELP